MDTPRTETQRTPHGKQYYRRWMLRAPLGLVLVGFGLSLVIEAGFYKHSGAATWEWVGFGTLALVVFNSGLCIFGDAILQRVRYERTQLAE
ncbi:MAG: hypothetical protein AAFO03_05810 [Bacteroidota bacterium]